MIEMIRGIRSRPRLVLVLLAGLAAGSGLAGCGDLTAGGFADADVAVTGDAGETGTAASVVGDPAAADAAVDPAAARVPGPRLSATESAAGLEGTVRIRLGVELRADDGTWIEVGDGPSEVEVDAAGADVVTAIESAVEAGSYSRARISVHEVEAVIRSGLFETDPPAGRTDTVDVDFEGADRILVERPLNLELEAGGSVRLVVNLNSIAWLRAATRALPVVGAEHFREAVEIGTGPRTES